MARAISSGDIIASADIAQAEASRRPDDAIDRLDDVWWRHAAVPTARASVLPMRCRLGTFVISQGGAIPELSACESCLGRALMRSISAAWAQWRSSVVALLRRQCPVPMAASLSLTARRDISAAPVQGHHACALVPRDISLLYAMPRGAPGGAAPPSARSRHAPCQENRIKD